MVAYWIVADLFMARKSGPGWLKGLGWCCFQIPVTASILHLSSHVVHLEDFAKVQVTATAKMQGLAPSLAPSGSRGRGAPKTFSSGGCWKVVHFICTATHS